MPPQPDQTATAIDSVFCFCKYIIPSVFHSGDSIPVVEMAPPGSEQLHSGNGAADNPSYDELQDFKTPFNAPFSVKINPHVSTRSWIKFFNEWLLEGDKAFNPENFQQTRILDTDLPGLAARFYPEAEEWGMKWGTKLFYLICILDDTMDATLGKSPQAAMSLLLEIHLVMMWSFPDDPVLRKELAPFLNIVKNAKERQEKMINLETLLATARTQPGTVYPGEISTVSNLFRDVWGDAIRTRTATISVLRLGHAVQYWLQGCLMEAEDRESNAAPKSIEGYIKLRKRTSATPCAMAGVDIIYGLTSPEVWYKSPLMQHMLDAVNDIGSWHNDIWSFKKEVLVDHEKFNLVLAVSVQRKVSYTEAAKIATQMLNDRINDLEQAAENLEEVTPPYLQYSLSVYRESCRCLVAGTHDWHSTTIRNQ